MKKLLLLAVLMLPMLVWAQSDCPTTFPPDACDEGGVGVTPIPPPVIVCPCYTAAIYDTHVQDECLTPGGFPFYTHFPTPAPASKTTDCAQGGPNPPLTSFIRVGVTASDSCWMILRDCGGAAFPCAVPVIDTNVQVLSGLTAAEITVCENEIDASVNPP